MEKCQYPVPAQAIYDPNFTAITTSSAQLFRVNEWSHQYVVNDGNSGSSVIVIGETITGQRRPVLVDNDGTVHVRFDNTPGVQKGACTDPSDTGEIGYDNAAFSTLDSITLTTGQILEIYGIHSSGDLQARVELITDDSVNVTKLLVGIVTETYPNWDTNLTVPLEVIASSNLVVTLRIKSLRCDGDIGAGTGRIFARLV